MVQLRNRKALRAPARYAETVSFSRLGTPIESTASPEPDLRSRRTLPPGTRPAYRLPIVEFNPNLPPAAFPTLGPDDTRPEGNNGRRNRREEDPMDIDESDNASESSKSDDDVTMGEAATSDEEGEAEPYEDGYESEEFKVPEIIEWSDITPILRWEIVDNMSVYYESSEIMGTLNLNERQKRELIDDLMVIDRRIELENRALENMQKKQLRALLRIDNSRPRDDRVPGILVFKNIEKKFFKKPVLKSDPGHLLSRVSDVMIAREYLRRIGLDPDLAGKWSNGYAKIEMDPYGQGEEKLRWIFDTDKKRKNGIEQDTVKQLGVKRLPRFPGEGPKSKDPYLKSKLDFINCFGNAQSDPYNVVSFQDPVAKNTLERHEEGHHRSHDTGIFPITLGPVPEMQRWEPAHHQRVTKTSETAARTTAFLPGKRVRRRADGVPILRKIRHSEGTSTRPIAASNGPSGSDSDAVPETTADSVSGVAADELASQKVVGSPTTSDSTSASKGCDLVRLCIGPDGAARTHTQPAGPNTSEPVQSGPVDATVQPVASQNAAFSSQPIQPNNTGAGAVNQKDDSRTLPTSGAGAKKQHELPAKRLLSGAWFFHSTQENWKGSPKAPKKSLGKSAEDGVSVKTSVNQNPLGQFQCFALPTATSRQGQEAGPATRGQTRDSLKASAEEPVLMHSNERESRSQGTTVIDTASGLKATYNEDTPPHAAGDLPLASNRNNVQQNAGIVVRNIQNGIQGNGLGDDGGIGENGPQLSTAMPPPPLPNRPQLVAIGKTRANSSGSETPVNMASENYRNGSQIPATNANGHIGKGRSQPPAFGTQSNLQNGSQYVMGVANGLRYRQIPGKIINPYTIMGTIQQKCPSTYAQAIRNMLLNPPPTCNPQEIMLEPREPVEQLQQSAASATCNEEGIQGDELMRDLEVIPEVPDSSIPSINPVLSRDTSNGEETVIHIDAGAPPANPELVMSNGNGNVGYINGHNRGQVAQGTEVIQPTAHQVVALKTGTQRRKSARKTAGQRARSRKKTTANDLSVEGSAAVASETSAPVVVQNNDSVSENPVAGMTDPPAGTAASHPTPKPRKKRLQNSEKKPRTTPRKRPQRVKLEAEADATGQ